MNIQSLNVVNSAGGIAIPEKTFDAPQSSEQTLPFYDRSKERGLKLDSPETLPPVIIYNREIPKFHENASFSPPDDEVLSTSFHEY